MTNDSTINDYRYRLLHSEKDVVDYTLILFILLGLILKVIYNPLVSNESERYGNATMNIISNSIIIFISIFYLINNLDNSENNTLFFLIIFYNILILGEIFILNYYYKEINMNNVPKKYKIWSFFTSSIIIIYTILFIVEISKWYSNSFTNFILFVSSFILFISLIIQFIILKYFMVDS